MPHKGKGKGKKHSKGTKPQAAKAMSPDPKSDGSKEEKEKTVGATSSTATTVASPSSASSLSQESTMKPANTKTADSQTKAAVGEKTKEPSTTTPSPSKTEPAKTAQPSKPADSQTKTATEVKPKEPSLPKDAPGKTPATQPQEPAKAAPPTKTQEPAKAAPPTKTQEPAKAAPPTKPQEPAKAAPPTKPQEPAKTAPPTKPQEPSKTTPATKLQEPSKTTPATKPQDTIGTKVSPPATEKPKANVTAGAKETGAKPTQASSKAGAKMSIDALDELMGTLPPDEPLPDFPEFTGPTVDENKSKSLHVDKLGERDDTLPPEYRKLLEKNSTPGKSAPAEPADEKAAKKPKSLPSDSEALDVLCEGFASSPLPPEKKAKTEKPPFESDPIDELSLGFETVSSQKSAPQQSAPGKPKTVSSQKSAPQQSAPGKPKTGEMSLDALDELAGSLAPVELPESPVFTGPEVQENKLKSKHISKLGERDDTLPPEYRKLLEKEPTGGKGAHTGKAEEKPKVPQKSMSDNDAIDALSGDFGGSPATTPQSKAQPGSKTPASSKAATDIITSEVISATSAAPVQSAAVPQSPQMPGQALDDLVGSLDTPVPESPKFTGPAVDEKKSKEKHIDKLGERDDTIPPEYRELLEKASTDSKDSAAKKKEGKPDTPKKSTSENDAIDALDALSGDFVSSPTSTPQSKAQPGSLKSGSTTSTPAHKSSETITASAAGKVAAPPPTSKSGGSTSSPAPLSSETITASTASKVSAPVPPKGGKDVTLDSLADTLPKQSKDKPAPAEDKVKEKHGSEKKDKLGEREDTIVPDHRIIEDSKHKGQPADKGKSPSKSAADEQGAIDALSSGFISSTSAPKVQSAVSSHPPQKPASTAQASEAITCSSASKVSAAPSAKPACTAQASETITCSSASKVSAAPSAGIKDAALDSLADTLPKQPKDKPTPTVDKVKEKHGSEHTDKCGEREDTIPADYRFIEEAKGKSQPAKPAAKDEGKGKDPAKAAKDSEAGIDALAGEFSTCDSTKAKSKEAPKTDSQKSKS
ncbi:calpastatin isoform X2 [Protopterus annectens]|uniref:calpastatin isoform X2 n=2 Tax=Protopterus annectens TaxID=7888 RepID=UPI001CFA9A30|nr:calpastatin isoform X2 [Protopterus annectens]